MKPKRKKQKRIVWVSASIFTALSCWLASDQSKRIGRPFRSVVRFSFFLFSFYFIFFLFVFFGFFFIRSGSMDWLLFFFRSFEAVGIGMPNEFTGFLPSFCFVFTVFQLISALQIDCGKRWDTFYRVLLGFIGFYWVLLGFTRSYQVLPSFTGFYRVLPRSTDGFVAQVARSCAKSPTRAACRCRCATWNWSPPAKWPSSRSPSTARPTRNWPSPSKVRRYRVFFFFFTDFPFLAVAGILVSFNRCHHRRLVTIFFSRSQLFLIGGILLHDVQLHRATPLGGNGPLDREPYIPGRRVVLRTTAAADGFDDNSLIGGREGPTANLPVKIAGGARNTFVAEFVPREVGTHTISVDYNGLPVTGTPFTCKVYDAAKVYVSAMPAGVLGKSLQFTGQSTILLIRIVADDR